MGISSKLKQVINDVFNVNTEKVTMTSRQKRKDVDNKLEASLIPIGFVKNKNGLFIKKIEDKFEVILTMAAGADRRGGKFVFLSPHVGVIHHAIEEIHCQLMYDKNDNNEPYDVVLTASSNIGYLMPQNECLSWDIPIDASEHKTQAVIDKIIASLQKYVLPFVEALKDEKKLLKAFLDHKIGLTFKNRFKIPLTYFVLGQKEAGLEYAQQTLASLRPSPKNEAIPEPHFESKEEAWEYFRRDKEPYNYYFYKVFFIKYQKLLEETS